MNVVDANIVLSGIRSRNGASHFILMGMLRKEIPFAASPAVVFEYEDVLTRPGILGPQPWIGPERIGEVLDALCAMLTPVTPYFRYRPFLRDPKDDLYIECAMAAGARIIVSHDKHFQDAVVPAFGLEVLGAGEFVSRWRQERKPS